MFSEGISRRQDMGPQVPYRLKGGVSSFTWEEWGQEILAESWQRAGVSRHTEETGNVEKGPSGAGSSVSKAQRCDVWHNLGGPAVWVVECEQRVRETKVSSRSWIMTRPGRNSREGFTGMSESAALKWNVSAAELLFPSGSQGQIPDTLLL